MFRFLAATAAAVLCLCALPALAKDDLLETLAQKGVLTLEEYEKLKAQRKTEITATTEDGFKITSGDGAASLQVGTLQQLDYAEYNGGKAALSDGSEMRRSRLSVGGHFLKDWQYRVEYEFSGTTAVTDAYVAYTALKPVTVTIGQFKQPFGMEALSADKNATFMERGLPFAFVITRAPGAMLGSSGTNWSLNGGLFGEPLSNAQAGEDGYAAVGRATYAPLLEDDQVVHLGLGLTWRQPNEDNSTNTTGPKFTTARFRSKPESNVLSQRLVDTGEIPDVEHYNIAGLELAGQWGVASLQAEYHWLQVEPGAGSALSFGGWYTQFANTLTGEKRPYRADRGVFDGIRPTNNFGKDGWGAFEAAVRLSGLDLTDDTVIGGEEKNATLGLNWYVNPILRVSANLVKVMEINGGPMDANEPTIYQMRLQLAL